MKNSNLEKALRSAKASLELSGFQVDERHTELIRHNLLGELSDEDF
ncbi:hypothetical protein [Bacillus sp. THAF10]|nr:hypothetical protein [Bacillus sp. THAF10]